MDRLLTLCFFLSGLAGLVYQVVWLRWLVLIFGATTLAISTVLTAFMGGLALGSWVAGRQAHRIRSPFLAYGLLELAIGAYALALPRLLTAVEPSLALLTGAQPSFVVLSAGRFALATLLLVTPTACMGATLPVLAQHVGRTWGTMGRRVGSLYAVNTFGAVLGTAVAGFVLLPVLGAWRTNLTAVVVNGIVGLAGLWLHRQTHAPALPAGGEPSPTGPTDGPVVDRVSPATVASALVVVACSGLVAMIYEVAWTRALALVLGSSVYAFTVMLTTFLLGLAGGSALMARMVDRISNRGAALGLVQLYVAVGTYLGLLVVRELPYAFVALFRTLGPGHGSLMSVRFLLAGAVLIVPTMALGAVFPLVVRMVAASSGRIGRTVGSVYAWNTLGAITGAFLGGFVLVPRLGVRGALLTGIAVNLVIALVALLGEAGGRRRFSLAVAGLVVIMAAAVTRTVPPWNPMLMASGVAVYAPHLQSLDRQAFLMATTRQSRLLYYREGLTASVSVQEAADGGRFLRVNGKTDASSTVDMLTQVMAGHLPLLLAPAYQDVLVIGLGSGVTAGAVARHAVRQMTVVELEDAVREGARYFDDVSGRPLDDPRTRLAVNDGRNFLVTSGRQYDVIVSEPSNPWMTGVANLFTVDFFRLGLSRLRPDGVFCQWLQLYGLDPAMVRTALATFRSVFPHVLAFEATAGDLLLVGSRLPLRLDLDDLQARLSSPAVAADLQRVGVATPADLLARFRLDGPAIDALAAGTPLNTDDNALIEFAAPRTLYAATVDQNHRQMAARFPGLRPVTGPTAWPDETLLQVVERQLAMNRAVQAEQVAREALAPTGSAPAHHMLGRVLLETGRVPEGLAEARRSLERDPTYLPSWLVLGRHALDRGDPAEALGAARQARRRHPTSEEAAALEARALYDLREYRQALAAVAAVQGREPAATAPAHLARGLSLWRLGDPEARAVLSEYVASYPGDPLGHQALGSLEFEAGLVTAATERWARAVDLRRLQGEALLARARAQLAQGQTGPALEFLGQAARVAPFALPAREELARALERTGQTEAAIREWEFILPRAPNPPLAHLALARLWRARGDRDRARQHLDQYLARETDSLRIQAIRREFDGGR